MVQPKRLPAVQRREVIMHAAVEEFARSGARGTTLDAVARRAGVTKPLLYRHVTSKDALYVEVLEVEAQRLLDAVRTALPAGAAVQRESVGRAVDAFLAWASTNPAAHRLLLRDPESGEAAIAAHARVQATLTEAIAAALASDPSVLPGDPDRERALALTAHVLKMGLNGLAVWWWEHPDVPREEVRDRALALLWPGLEELRS